MIMDVLCGIWVYMYEFVYAVDCALSVCTIVKFKNVVHRFDSELTQALEEADNEREQKDKAIQENTALGAGIFSLRQSLTVWTRVRLQTSVNNECFLKLFKMV